MSKTITTPKGVLGAYPYLSTPDTKFNADGEYKASLILPLEEALPLIEAAEEAFKEAYADECRAKKKKSLKKADMPWDIDEEEGTATLRFKLKSKIQTKTKGTMTRRVKIFDAKGKLIPKPAGLKEGGGSEVKIAYQYYFWYSPTVGFGLQLQLEAAQIITLVEYSGGGGGFGFGEEEGGFDADDADLGGDDFDDDEESDFDDEEGSEEDEGDDEDDEDF